MVDAPSNTKGEKMKNEEDTTNENHDEGSLVKVEVLNASGHSTLMLSPQETEQYVGSQAQSWVFVDDRLIQAGQVATVDWNAIQSVRVMPGLVGGVSPPATATLGNSSEQGEDEGGE